MLDTFAPPRAGVTDDRDLIARARQAVGSIQNERLKGLFHVRRGGAYAGSTISIPT